MIDGKYFFDQPIKNYIKVYENIQKITAGQRDYYTTGCLLDCNYFIKHYKIKAIDFSKQQALDADSKKIQQINFTENLDDDDNNNRLIIFIMEEEKETILDF